MKTLLFNRALLADRPGERQRLDLGPPDRLFRRHRQCRAAARSRV